MPNDDKIFHSNKISKIIVPATWVKKKYSIQLKQNKKKLKEWYIGVNEKVWKPNNKIEKIYDYLIYKKHIYDEEIYFKILKYLRSKKIKIKIMNYGTHHQSEYYNFLCKSKKLIFFSQSESQGISNFEAWSCNVPTLIYNPGYWIYENKRYKSNSCPHLSNQTGLYFKNLKDFKMKLKIFDKKKFKPRLWILKKGTIDYSIKKLFKILV